VIDFLQSKTFIDTLKEKFEIPVEVDIFSDNYFDGGGFVISPPNSYLGYHADFNFSSKNHKYRVLNLLIYMNPEYKIEYGGHLHALDPISKTVEAIYVPFMNSAFAFFTDDKSFHGVSRNRSDFYRRSFNLYYYADKPISEFQSRKPHKTIWLDIEKGNYEH
jgi:Rps23 Pro-64 3,4-dihydroxylase Tpa1-like proline 4-hydroxylase